MGISAFAVAVCLGQVFFAGKAPRSAKVSKATATARVKDKAEKGSTQGYLAVALRLAEMTQVATALQAAGQLDGEAARALDEELTSIEAEIDGIDDSTARDLRSMVSVVRGTLYKHSENISDEQVEQKGDSYTYASPRYWDEYYKKTSEEERFDWYVSWDTKIADTPFTPFGAGEQRIATSLADILGSYLEKESRILMLGCGNSDMSEKMYRAGFEDIVNIDISEQLMDKLRDKLGASMPRMRWLYMNASSLGFDAASFDVVVDKGTLDAIEGEKDLVLSAIREAHRTLRPGGVLLSITFNQASIRIDNQLQLAIEWASCHTHGIEKTAHDGQKSSVYVHACVRQ